MVGRTISHYRVVEKLGEGGMGVVYKAEDTRLGRTVALKFPRSGGLVDEDDKARFLREAEAAAALNHPNICTVHEIDEFDGLAFIVMEFVEGQSVKKKARKTPLTLEAALDIAIQAAQGLQAAHGNGVTHRDIKSANLMVTSQGQVKVMDFGLAQIGDRSQLTKTGTTLGTAAYMSPEQALAQPIDRRTDIWSLGVVLYEMLTGRLPFEGGVDAAVAYAVVNREPQPVTALRSGVPIEVDRIIEKALAKKRGERYQRVDQFLADLRALRTSQLAGSRITAPKRLNRRQLALLGAGVAVAAPIVAVGLNVGRLRDRMFGFFARPVIESIAILPIENLSGQADQEYFADGMTEGLITSLAKIGALKVISHSSVKQYQGTDKQPRQIARELDVDAVVQGAVQLAGNRVRLTAQIVDPSTGEILWAESYDRDSADVLMLQSDLARSIADQIAVSVTPEESSRLAAAAPVHPEAYEAYLRGRVSLDSFSARDFENAEQYFHLALERDSNFSLAYAGLAAVWSHRVVLGLVPPLEAAPKWKEAVTRAVELDDASAEGQVALANFKTFHEFDWAGGEAAYRRAIELNPNHAYARAFYSHLLTALHRAEEAAPQIQRALELDPLNPFIQGLYGLQLMFAHRYDDAITQFRNMLRMAPDLPLAHRGLFNCLHMKGRHEEALAEMRALYAADREVAEALVRGYQQGGYQGALNATADTLAERSRRVYVKPIRIAQLYERAGNVEQALAWHERGMELRDHDMAYRSVAPVSDATRSHPRFQALLRRLNLPL
jgi:TolB-like protein/predicted Ser/Thr protein kinase